MRVVLSYLFFIFILGTSGLFAQSPREIFQQFRNKMCLVKFYKNVSSQSQIGSYIKLKQYRIGVVVKPDGLVMVNSDVYPLSLDILSGEGASFSSGEPTDFKIKSSDGKEYPATFVGKDDISQVAFLQINKDSLTHPLPFVQFQPTDSVTVGEQVYLLEFLAETYHFEPMFTHLNINAIIHSPRKKFLVNNAVTALSAGGLVINSAGDAIGVTLRTEFSYHFMAPSEFDEFQKEYLEIAPSEWFTGLIENPPVLVRRKYRGKPWLGIGMQALTPELKNFWNVPADGGVIIDRIYPKSPAEKAGLKIKDVIIAYNDKPLEIDREEELNRMRELVLQTPPGSTVQLKIFRNGKLKTKTITLSPAPRAIDLAEKYQSPDLGIEVRELTYDVLYDYNFPPDTRGVYVYQVDRTSPAGLGGLEVGSVITKVNNKPVTDLSSFQSVIRKVMAEHPPKIMFQVQQRSMTDFVFVDLK